MSGTGAATDGWVAQADFFMSYAEEDAAWADWVAWHLIEAGYEVRHPAWVPMVVRPETATDALGADRSNHVIALFSDARSDSADDAEWHNGPREHDGAPRGLIRIRLTDCRLPSPPAGAATIDLFGLSEDEALERLRGVVVKTLAGSAEASDASPFPPLVSATPSPTVDTAASATIRPAREDVSARGLVERWKPDDTAKPDKLLGRQDEIEYLVGELRATSTGPSGTGVVQVVGAPGTGKTALVRHAARKAMEEHLFDLTLFADLGGHDKPEQLYAPLLKLLHPDQQIPGTIMAQSNAYREALAERAKTKDHVLLVFDNVHRLSQVKPLLPEQPAHRVLTISRARLYFHGSELELGGLDETAAVELLKGARPEAAEKLTGHQEQAAKLARLCQHQPMALCFIAVALASPDRTAAELAGKLATRLPTVTGDGESRPLHAAFDLAWSELSRRDERAAELFRLLWINPGPEISTQAAEALPERPPPSTEELLETLRGAYLVEEAPKSVEVHFSLGVTQQTAQQRWRINRTVRWDATSRESSDAERAAALSRLLDHYLECASYHAEKAGWFLRRHSRPQAEPSKRHESGARDAALRWFRREEPNLLGCLDLIKGIDEKAAGLGRAGSTAILMSSRLRRRRPNHASQRRLVDFAEAMAGYLRNDGPWERAADVHRHAADAAKHLGDLPARGVALNDLGITLRLLAEREEAIKVLKDAYRLFNRSGNTRSALLGQANASNELGIVYNDEGRYDEAIRVLTKANNLYSTVSDKIGVANSSKSLGMAKSNLGRNTRDRKTVDEARTLLENARDRYQDINDELGIAEASNQLGRLWLLLGEPGVAAKEFTDAQQQAAAANCGFEEARAWEGIGECQARTDISEARKSFESAQECYARVGAENDRAWVRERVKDLEARLTPGTR